MGDAVSGIADIAKNSAAVSAVIPCLEEEEAIGNVVAQVRAQGVTEVIVVDGGSRDRTVERAACAGARIVIETQRGYGRAVQAGIAAASPNSEILLFLDGDGSDPTECIPALIEPITTGRAVFVSGSRLRGERESGSLSAQQLVAGHAACFLLRAIYGVSFTDMSPFRAIRRDVFERLDMREMTYGWNLEMLMRIAASGLSCVEIPVGQRRRRGGVSKVSGNWFAAVRAACAIAATFVRLAVLLRGARPQSRSSALSRRP